MADADFAPSRRNGVAVTITCLLLSACSPEPTPDQKAAQDAHDIAQVEAVQRQTPPPKPIAPLPIVYDDMQKHGLFDSGCAFAPGSSIGAVLLAQDMAAYLKLGGRMVRLAADPGSTRIPPSAWSRYTGKEFAISLTRLAATNEADDNANLRWSGRLTVTDAFEQVVYNEDGQVQCTA